MQRLTRLLKWAERNERHLGAILFVFGFIGDLLTFAFLSITLVNLAFMGYLILAALTTFGSHLFADMREHAKLWRRILAIICPLAAQYAIGSLLSGCLIFYTKSAAVIVSWPFLVILALVFIGNEYFRTYYKHLAFQLGLLFFGIYAYAIFALPLYVHELGPRIFLASTLLSLAVFILYVYGLARARTGTVGPALRYAVPTTVLIIVIMNVSYFSGLIPPIPLTLPSSGIYHGVSHEGNDYVLLSEGEKPWWDIRPQVVHHVAGSPLYAFSSVSAPIAFDTSIVHVWEYFDDRTHTWVEENHIAFLISGGRGGGYRGYSQVSDPASGKWRVTIETTSGQIIGRLYFTVVDITTEPALTQITK
jgi:hypothetical protein